MTPLQLRLYRAASQVVAEWVLRATRMPSAAALNELTAALEAIDTPPEPELLPMGSGHYSLTRGSPKPPSPGDLRAADLGPMSEWLVYTSAPIARVELVYLLNVTEGIYRLRTGADGHPEVIPWVPPAGARYWPWSPGNGPTLWPRRSPVEDPSL